jgi:hypothetical protein
MYDDKPVAIIDNKTYRQNFFITTWLKIWKDKYKY